MKHGTDMSCRPTHSHTSVVSHSSRCVKRDVGVTSPINNLSNDIMESKSTRLDYDRKQDGLLFFYRNNDIKMVLDRLRLVFW